MRFHAPLEDPARFLSFLAGRLGSTDPQMPLLDAQLCTLLAQPGTEEHRSGRGILLVLLSAGAASGALALLLLQALLRCCYSGRGQPGKKSGSGLTVTATGVGHDSSVVLMPQTSRCQQENARPEKASPWVAPAATRTAGGGAADSSRGDCGLCQRSAERHPKPALELYGDVLGCATGSTPGSSGVTTSVRHAHVAPRSPPSVSQQPAPVEQRYADGQLSVEGPTADGGWQHLTYLPSCEALRYPTCPT